MLIGNPSAFNQLRRRHCLGSPWTFSCAVFHELVLLRLATTENSRARDHPLATRIAFYRSMTIEEKKGCAPEGGYSALRGGWACSVKTRGRGKEGKIRVPTPAVGNPRNALFPSSSRARGELRACSNNPAYAASGCAFGSQHGDLPAGIREGKPFNPFTLEDMRTAKRRNAISVIAASEAKWQACRSDGAFRELFAVSRIPAKLLMQFTSYQSPGYWLVRKNNNIVTNIFVSEVEWNSICTVENLVALGRYWATICLKIKSNFMIYCPR